MPRRYNRGPRPPRNTAPTWKKLSVVLSGPIVAALVLSTMDTGHMSSLVLVAITIVIVAVVVWLMAKLLGVRLSLHSWD